MFKRTLSITLLYISLASTSIAGGHSKDIVDTAVAAGSFETLVTAVAAACGAGTPGRPRQYRAPSAGPHGRPCGSEISQ